MKFAWPPFLHSYWRRALAAAMALLVAGIVLAAFNESAYKTQKKSEIGVQAQILSASVAPALLFQNNNSAQEYLDALSANADLEAAAVYDAGGARVAVFHRADAAMPPARASPAEPRFEGRDVIAVTAVAQNGEQLGAVYLRAATESPVRRFSRYAGIAILIIMAALVLAVLGRAQSDLAAANDQLRAKARALELEIEERARAEEALLQSRKLEAIGQLTGGVAHDFNNLLTVVLGGLRMLERHDDPQKRAATMEAMRHAVERGAGLTRQLLAFSRRETLRLEAVDVARQLQTMHELLQRSLRADILIDFQLAEDVWPVMTDPAQLELAVLNLSVNARDAMPKGGMLTVAARNATSTPDGKAGDFVEISVRDTGMGIPPEVIERVFEPYFTTKQTGQGTGLGLSQVYGFALQSGGSIKLESVVNEGTCVRLFLPRSAAAVEPAVPRAETRVEKRAQHASILVVEDDDTVATFVMEMLEHLGYRRVRVSNASAALEALARSNDFDLVFSDIVMPGGMNGVELANQIRRLYPQLPIVLTTGYAGSSAPAPFPTLRKPYQMEELEQILTAALAVAPQAANG